MIAPSLRLQRVLCALDVERSARAPLAHAGLLSQQLDVPLDGLYVTAPLGEWGNRLERVRRLIAEHNAHQRLDELLAPFASSLDVQAFVTRGANGDVIDAHATQHNADLIVLGGARKRVGTSSSGLASILSARADRGVLTVPGDSPACALRRILLPVTADTLETPALAWTIKLARRFGASVQLVGLAPASSGFWRGLTRRSPVVAELEDGIRVTARVIERCLSAASVPVGVQHAAVSLADVEPLVEATETDLVVVGLPAWAASPESALLERLRRHGNVPVLSIRARAALAAAGARCSFGENWELSASA